MLVRILFPGVGLLVISAWCLGILNSHRRFLLSYSVGVVLNGAMIAAVLIYHDQTGNRIAMAAAWGAVAGSLLQIVVQWPVVRSVGGEISLSAWRGVEGVSTVVRTFLPNVISRGANQISAYIDMAIATYLSEGTVAAMFNAQMIYTLPVSLFGMAVSAAELPEMSREQGDPATIAQALRVRLDGATKRLAFYIVPSAAAFLCVGDIIAAAIYQTGKFTAHDSRYVWLILGGSAIGLLASTLGRLYASTFYALGDTKTPLYCGLVRVALTGALGWVAALILPRMFGWPATWGAGGLTASAGAAGWVEFVLLRRGLCRQIGRFDLPRFELLKLWISAIVAALLSTALRFALPDLSPIPLAVIILPAYGLCYLGVTLWWQVPEAAVFVGQIQRTLRR
jgi:putative peptidoglycan lipid II flippase